MTCVRRLLQVYGLVGALLIQHRPWMMVMMMMIVAGLRIVHLLLVMLLLLKLQHMRGMLVDVV